MTKRFWWPRAPSCKFSAHTTAHVVMNTDRYSLNPEQHNYSTVFFSSSIYEFKVKCKQLLEVKIIYVFRGRKYDNLDTQLLNIYKETFRIKTKYKIKKWIDKLSYFSCFMKNKSKCMQRKYQIMAISLHYFSNRTFIAHCTTSETLFFSRRFSIHKIISGA